MALEIDLPDDVLQRLESVASLRGMTTTELAVETLSALVRRDDDLMAIVEDVVAEHRTIIDRLAET